MHEGYSAKVILDSVGPNGARLITLEHTHPRMVHADFMTHRVFSRNASSSRAIPVEKLMDKVERMPVMPVFWGENQAGMQASKELEGAARAEAERLWIEARDFNVQVAKRLGYKERDGGLNLHKQLSNRLIEPWMFITCVVTLTEFSNYEGLRIGGGAQPELEYSATLARDAIAKSTPQKLESGQWHLPYVTGYDEDELRIEREFSVDRLKAISVGRCAAVSYLKQDQSKEALDDERRAMERLYPSGHMSPFEHVAMALTEDEWIADCHKASFLWAMHRKPVGNLWGWRQWRKELDNEHDFSKIKAVSR